MLLCSDLPPNGPFNLSLNCRSAWRPIVGGIRFWFGSDISIHLARREREHTMNTATDPKPPPVVPTVFVVDDDESIRESLSSLIPSVSLRIATFATAADLQHQKLPDAPACLALDIRLPGLSGMDLQRELAASNRRIPIIFITGSGDFPMSVRAIKAGAVEFLTKPFATRIYWMQSRNPSGGTARHWRSSRKWLR